MNLRVLIPLLLLTACQPPRAPLADARIGGPFTLIDQNGRVRTDSDFAGKYRIMYFGYTHCPDVCPVDVGHLAAGYRAFAMGDPTRGSRVVPVFVSVDPTRDTPAVLKEFTGNFDPALVGLTGTTAQVAAIAREYGVAYQIVPGATAGTYLVDHTRAAFLMGPAGEPLALLSHEAKPDVIAGELAKWVR